MRGIVVSPFALSYLCLIFLSKIYPFFFFFPLLLLFLSLLCLPYASLPYLTFHNFPFFSFFFPHSSSPIHPFPNLRPILLSPLLLYLCPNSHFPRTILIHYINTTSVLPPLPTACAFPLTPSSSIIRFSNSFTTSLLSGFLILNFSGPISLILG